MSAHIVVHTPEGGAVPLEGCPVSVIETRAAKNTSDLITVRQAAAELQVQPNTIYRWCARGLLHPVRLGTRAVRLRRSDIERLKKN
nr:MAG TPA: helix-turn-helix domain protein [Caudoviricetes sp.]